MNGWIEENNHWIFPNKQKSIVYWEQENNKFVTIDETKRNETGKKFWDSVVVHLCSVLYQKKLQTKYFEDNNVNKRKEKEREHVRTTKHLFGFTGK